jgi:hypothetical protein
MSNDTEQKLLNFLVTYKAERDWMKNYGGSNWDVINAVDTSLQALGNALYGEINPTGGNPPFP